MTARDSDFTSATGGGPSGPADAGERNLAPGTHSPHAPATPGPAMGASRPHESARAQVAGSATYIDDIAEVRGTLHAAPILSTVGHGMLRGVDTAAALAMPGVRAVVLSKDIPGDPLLATFVHDEPIFARDRVEHIGQVVGLVVADTVMQARRAARHVKLDIEPLPVVLDVREAHAKQSYVLPPVIVRRGEPEAALAASRHQLSGQLEVGGQEHFYLEGQVAYALPLEQDQWWIYSSTQHPGEVQHWVAHALGLENNAVTVECRRMGGGFGGKETQAGHLAVWAALAARKTGRAVKLRLDRDDDFLVTGKRHPFAYDWQAGFDDDGRLTGLKVTMLANCGFSADLSGPVADRAIFHTDNAYYLSDVEIASYRCKTNTQSHTAFRGFGGPQGVILIEAILGEIARKLGKDPLAVRKANLYGVGERDTTHYQMKVEDNILHPLHRPDRADLALPGAARRHRGLECVQPGHQARHRDHAGQVRHQLHRHLLQPGRRAGARVHRRQRAGQPRRHRDGPGPAHQDHAGGGRRTRACRSSASSAPPPKPARCPTRRPRRHPAAPT
jgi:xanthine dehydrogenase large subunit